MTIPEKTLAVPFGRLRRDDVAVVGGKNASLGELIAALTPAGVRVPTGFATTAAAYWRFVDANGLHDVIAARLEDKARGRMTLAEAGEAIRRAFVAGDWPDDVAAAIRLGYRELCAETGEGPASVAVRSSATATEPFSWSLQRAPIRPGFCSEPCWRRTRTGRLPRTGRDGSISGSERPAARSNASTPGTGRRPPSPGRSPANSGGAAGRRADGDSWSPRRPACSGN